MALRLVACLAAAFLIGLSAEPRLPASRTAQEAWASSLRARIEASPTLPLHGHRLAVHPPYRAWESGAVSWVAVDPSGNLYELQRGDKTDPILVLDRAGKLIRSWGRGDFTLPHSIRLDPMGNVWAVDAGSSNVLEYSPAGKKLLTIQIGEFPDNGNPFHGATDIAFGPHRRIFITDGYGNARVLEYDSNGKRIREWGKRGRGPGEFHLPHAIEIGPQGFLYIADRENGRIEKFDLDGKFMGELPNLGRIYGLKVSGEALWISTGPLDQPPGAPGWVVKLDAKTGRMLGHLNVPGERGGHAIDLMPNGEPVITLGTELLWFHP